MKDGKIVWADSSEVLSQSAQLNEQLSTFGCVVLMTTPFVAYFNEWRMCGLPRGGSVINPLFLSCTESSVVTTWGPGVGCRVFVFFVRVTFDAAVDLLHPLLTVAYFFFGGGVVPLPFVYFFRLHCGCVICAVSLWHSSSCLLIHFYYFFLKWHNVKQMERGKVVDGPARRASAICGGELLRFIADSSHTVSFRAHGRFF